MNGIRLTSIVLLLCIATAAKAETEIHKCTDADGGIVYSQLPCAPEKPTETAAEQAEDTEEQSVSDNTPVEFAALQVSDQPQRSAEELAACKKDFRDQIDAIDAEIRQEYAEEKADDYKRRLLQLTRQLRQCESS